ncbi:SAM-dependent methyltransferase [Saccharomonospora sp. CUA-673]|nr:SAM-dependent methyltransferase [Saccharomonospora sp. CUA-673]
MSDVEIEDDATYYSRRHAEIYDFIHAARGRDWAGESDELAERVRAVKPDADSLLDVACGTGAHLARLADHFSVTAGFDLSEGMCDMARRNAPRATITSGDMRTFRAERTYDAVVCMCFSLGYMKDREELEAAVAVMADCLAPGGVVIAEPWWFPENFLDGFVSGGIAEKPGLVVSRVSHTVREGNATRMSVNYTVAESRGIRSFAEQELYTLFELDEYLAAFAAAGLRAEYEPGGPSGRGLFTAVRA